MGIKNNIIDIKNKQILFIGPVFFDYTKLIIDDFEAKGAFVYFINEKRIGYWENILRRVSLRICKELTNKLMIKKINEAPDKVDIVFLIHGDLLNEFFMNFIKKKYKNSVFIMYQWDSVKNNKNTLFLSKYFDSIFSFDRTDCLDFGFNYLPNFYKKEKLENKTSKPNIDLLFIGKGHTDRISFLDKVKKNLPYYIKTKFVIQIPWYRYYFEKFIYKKRGSLLMKDFTFNKISFNKVQQLTNQSKVILDIHNPWQNGLTQRPFDALGNGKALITTNASIMEESFYDEEIIQVINRDMPAINSDIFKIDINIPHGFEEYSLENWSKKIFKLTNNYD